MNVVWCVLKLPRHSVLFNQFVQFLTNRRAFLLPPLTVQQSPSMFLSWITYPELLPLVTFLIQPNITRGLRNGSDCFINQGAVIILFYILLSMSDLLPPLWYNNLPRSRTDVERGRQKGAASVSFLVKLLPKRKPARKHRKPDARDELRWQEPYILLLWGSWRALPLFWLWSLFGQRNKCFSNASGIHSAH